MNQKKPEIRGQRSEVRSVDQTRRAGFTLIELIVVIGIILMLVGLVVSVSVALSAQSESRATQNTLRLVDAALKEWETTTDRQFTWGKDGQPANVKYDIQRDASAEDQTSLVLWRLRNTSGCKEILAKIDQDMFVNDTNVNPPRLKLLDAWGKEIVIVHPGRLPHPQLDPNAPTDADGTIRVTQPLSPDIFENRVGVCTNRRICFISAGPDGKFGHLEMGPDTPEYQQSFDNLFSYPLDKP